MKPKTRRPETDWEIMQADSDIVKPQKPKQEQRKENDYECERPEIK